LFDVAYYVGFYHARFGCGNQATIETSNSNLQTLTGPCFYATYYGILAPCIILIMLVAPAERLPLWKNTSAKTNKHGRGPVLPVIDQRTNIVYYTLNPENFQGQ
jgi:hypothetical protein